MILYFFFFFVAPQRILGFSGRRTGKERAGRVVRVWGRGKYISFFTFSTCTSQVSEMYAVRILSWLSREAEDGNSQADL